MCTGTSESLGISSGWQAPAVSKIIMLLIIGQQKDYKVPASVQYHAVPRGTFQALLVLFSARPIQL